MTQIPQARTGPRRLRSTVAASLFLLHLLIAATAVAQPLRNPTDMVTSGTSYRMFVEPGEPTIEVLLVGSAGNSGLYLIGEDTSLTELLALSGGATLPTTTDVVVRDVRVRLLRTQDAQRVVVYEAPIDQALLEPGNHPALQNGDLVQVEIEQRRRRRVTALQVLEVVARAASVTTLIIALATRL